MFWDFGTLLPMLGLGTDLQIYRFMEPALLVCFYSLYILYELPLGTISATCGSRACAFCTTRSGDAHGHGRAGGRQIVARVPLS